MSLFKPKKYVWRFPNVDFVRQGSNFAMVVPRVITKKNIVYKAGAIVIFLGFGLVYV